MMKPFITLQNTFIIELRGDGKLSLLTSFHCDKKRSTRYLTWLFLGAGQGEARGTLGSTLDLLFRNAVCLSQLDEYDGAHSQFACSQKSF